MLNSGALDTGVLGGAAWHPETLLCSPEGGPGMGRRTESTLGGFRNSQSETEQGASQVSGLLGKHQGEQ